jgi:hypothetical protein
MSCSARTRGHVLGGYFFVSFCVQKFFVSIFSMEQDAHHGCTGGCCMSDEAFDRIDLAHWIELKLV